MNKCRGCQKFVVNKIYLFLISIFLGFNTSCFAVELEDEYKPVFTPYIGIGIVHDDNLLGLANIVDPLLTGLVASGLSDTFYNTQAGLKFNKKVSLQRFTADLNVTDVRFDRFRQLNHQDKSINANWEWHVGSQVGGNLGLNYGQSLTPFVDFHELALNLRTQRTAYIDGYWFLDPSWRVRGGFSRYQLNYDLSTQRAGDRRQNVFEAGADYLARSGSSAGVQLRHTDANFPNLEQVGGLFIANSYSQDEIKAKVDWLVSGKSKLQFLGGWVTRKQESLTARDFSGFNARIVGDWQATGKIGANLTLWREIGAVDDLTTIYSLNHGISAALIWRYSEKIRIDAQFRREQRNFDSSGLLTSALAANSNDTLRTASLIAAYRPTRHWLLQMTLSRRSRSAARSTDFDHGYVSNSVALDTRYEF